MRVSILQKEERFFGLAALEVLEIPGTGEDRVSGRLCAMLGGLDNGMGLSLDLLRLSPPRGMGKGRGGVRTLLLLRATHRLRDAAGEAVSRAAEGTIMELEREGYALRELPYPDLLALLAPLRNATVLSLCKRVQSVEAATSPLPYCFYDTVGPWESGEAARLLAQNPGSALSVQLIAARCSVWEREGLAQLYADYDGIRTGRQAGPISVPLPGDALAGEACRQAEYYHTASEGPLFRAGLTVLGHGGSERRLAGELGALLRRPGGQPLRTLTCPMGSFSPEKIHDFPYRLGREVEALFRRTSFGSAGLPALPLKISPEEGALLLALPRDETCYSGLPVNLSALLPRGRDLPSALLEGSGRFILGDWDGRGAGLPRNDLARHMTVTGLSGMGKTNLLLSLCAQGAGAGLNVLAVEPVKSEYRILAGNVPGMKLFAAGSTDAPYMINLFLPPEGVELAQYRPALSDVFRVAFDMPAPLDSVFERALTRTYRRYGWQETSRVGDKEAHPFGLCEFLRVFREVVSASDYSGEVKGNLMGAGFFRLLSLVERDPLTFDTVHSIPAGDLMKGLTVLNLNEIRSDSHKALIMAVTLMGLAAYFRGRGRAGGDLRDLIFIDEAHVLLEGAAPGGGEGGRDPSAALRRLVEHMLMEFRALGVGVILSDQLPSRMGRAILAAAGAQCAFRVTEGSEVALLSDVMGLDADGRKALARLAFGQMLLSSPLLPEGPLLLRTRDTAALLPPPGEARLRAVSEGYAAAHPELFRPFAECALCLRGGCDLRLRLEGKHCAGLLLDACGKPPDGPESLFAHLKALPEALPRAYRCSPENPRFPSLCRCAAVQFYRGALLEGAFSITPAKSRAILEEALKNYPVRSVNHG